MSVQASSVLQHQVSPDLIQQAIGQSQSNEAQLERVESDTHPGNEASPSPDLNRDICSDMSGHTAKNAPGRSRPVEEEGFALNPRSTTKVVETQPTIN